MYQCSHQSATKSSSFKRSRVHTYLLRFCLSHHQSFLKVPAVPELLYRGQQFSKILPAIFRLVSYIQCPKPKICIYGHTHFPFQYFLLLPFLISSATTSFCFQVAFLPQSSNKHFFSCGSHMEAVMQCPSSILFLWWCSVTRNYMSDEGGKHEASREC